MALDQGNRALPPAIPAAAAVGILPQAADEGIIVEEPAGASDKMLTGNPRQACLAACWVLATWPAAVQLEV